MNSSSLVRSSGSRAPSYFFQHDMLMRKATIQKALQGKDVTKPDKNARKCDNPPCAEAAGFVSSSLARWPNPRRIPYVMSKSASQSTIFFLDILILKTVKPYYGLIFN